MNLNSISPSWVLPGAKFDLDFEHGRYWGGNVVVGDILPLSIRVQSMCGPNAQVAVAPYIVDTNGLVVAVPILSNRIVPGLGLLCEGATTNIALWNRDFTNAAWVKTNVTATKNQAGADLVLNSASILAATANNASCLQVISAASQSCLGSCFVKRISGSGTVSMTIDGGATYTDITSQLSMSGYTRVVVPIQTLTNPSVGFMLGSSGDSIAVDFFQVERGDLASVPTSPLASTTAAVQRFNEHISFANLAGGAAGNNNDGQRILSDVVYRGGPFSFVIKYSGNPVGGGGLTIGSDGTGAIGIAFGGANGTGANYAGETTSNVGNIGVGNWNKQAGRTNGGGSVTCLNGGSISAASSTTPLPPSTAWTHGSFGNNGSGTTGSPMQGYVARVILWDREISDGQMIEFTRAA